MSVHVEQVRHVYRIRLIGILIALVMVVAGIAGVFLGLQGSFDWAVQAPSGIGGKITNASPGILMVCIGVFLAWRIVEQPHLSVRTGFASSSTTDNRAR